MAVAYLLMLPMLLLPLGDPAVLSVAINLSPLSLRLSATAGVAGASVVALLLGILQVTRPDVRWRRRVREFVTMALVLTVFLGGGASVNEHVLKPMLGTPRPNIEILARLPTPAASLLGMPAQEFYALGDKQDRQAYLSKVLNKPETTDVLGLPADLRAHWLAETGYSFPSGHAFAAMLLATFFLAMGIADNAGWRRFLSYCIPGWAVPACYARPLLIVHTPADVLLGGLVGVALGSAAFFFARLAIDRTA